MSVKSSNGMEEDIIPYIQDNPPLLENNIERLLAELNDFKQKNYELLQTLEFLKNENIKLRDILNSQASNAPHKRARGSAPDAKNETINNAFSLTSNNNTSLSAVHNNSSAAAVYNENVQTNNNIDNLSSLNSNSNSNSAQTSSNVNNSSFSNNNSFCPVSVNNQNAKQKKKIFQTINTDLSTVKQKIKAANCNSFNIKQANTKAPIKITINSPDDISNVRNALKGAQISFHEFKWEDEKAKCFVIKGLVGAKECDLPFIKSELVDVGLSVNIQVSLFITGYMRANPLKTHNSLIKLVLPPNSDIAVIKKIKYIDHVAIKVEEFKAKNVVQCKNCQRFGHSTGGCMHPHRCVKCGENHLRIDCERTLDKFIKLNCCNCGGEHTANNLTLCTYFQQTYNRNKNIISNNNRSISINSGNNNKSTNLRLSAEQNAASRQPGLSYSSVAGGVAAVNTIDLSNKLDTILVMVSKHEQILAKFCNNV